MKITPDTIINIVNEYFGIIDPLANVSNQHREYVMARHVGMFFCREFTLLTNTSIGRLSNNNHVAVWHALKSVNSQYETNKVYRDNIDTIRSLIKARCLENERIDECDTFQENDFYVDPALEAKVDEPVVQAIEDKPFVRPYQDVNADRTVFEFNKLIR